MSRPEPRHPGPVLRRPDPVVRCGSRARRTALLLAGLAGACTGPAEPAGREPRLALLDRPAGTTVALGVDRGRLDELAVPTARARIPDVVRRRAAAILGETAAGDPSARTARLWRGGGPVAWRWEAAGTPRSWVVLDDEGTVLERAHELTGGELEAVVARLRRTDLFGEVESVCYVAGPAGSADRGYLVRQAVRRAANGLEPTATLESWVPYRERGPLRAEKSAVVVDAEMRWRLPGRARLER